MSIDMFLRDILPFFPDEVFQRTFDFEIIIPKSWKATSMVLKGCPLFKTNSKNVKRPASSNAFIC